MLPRRLLCQQGFRSVALILPLLIRFSISAEEPDNAAYRIPTSLPSSDEVLLANGVDVKGRKCTYFRVKHPVQRPHFRFHLAEVYLNDELQVPIYYAAYTWPHETGDAPRLLEEFAYKNIKLNVGLNNVDFEPSNPDYGFTNLQRILSASE